MGIKSILKIGATVAGGIAGVNLPPDHRIALALERIADALERIAPAPTSLASPNLKYPPLGILTADNETTAERESAEDAAIRSREEKLMKEYQEYVQWRERNVTKGAP